MCLRGRLGLGIGQDRLSAVLIVRGTVRWTKSRARDADTALGAALSSLLADCPRPRLFRARVTVAVGPSGVQLKRVSELPPLTDPRALAAMAREHASRFFLDGGATQVFSGARIDAPGCIWIAAFQSVTIREIADACRAAGFPAEAVVPTAIALRSAIDSSEIVWTDGDVCVAISYNGAELSQVRRTPTNGDHAAIPPIVGPIGVLGARAAEVLDAAGAACMPRDVALAVRAGTLSTRAGSPRRRSVVAAVASVVALMLLTMSPGLASSVAKHRARAQSRSIGRMALTAERDARALAAESTVLGALAAFERAHGSMAELLAELTRALPDQSAVVALEVDSSGAGSVVAVAPHAVAIVDALERVPVLASPVIVGPVTQESLGGRTLERVTVHFRVVPVTPP
jgi:hypothetical protein